MQPPQQRDEKTVVIATALGVFLLVLVVGSVGVWAADLLWDLSDAATTRLQVVVTVGAGAGLIGTLLRAR